MPGNYLAYAYFYKLFDEKKAEGTSGELAFGYAAKECIKAGYLTEIVGKEEFVMEYRPLLCSNVCQAVSLPIFNFKAALLEGI